MIRKRHHGGVEVESVERHRHPQVETHLTALCAYTAEDAVTSMRVQLAARFYGDTRVVAVRAPVTDEDWELVGLARAHARGVPNGYTENVTAREKHVRRLST